jgi:hypothetical protein
MKQLEAPPLSHLHRTSPIEHISASLDNMIKHPIDNAPWSEFNYVPKVAFSIAHGNDCLFIKYYVLEAVVKGAWYKSNDPVYKDSCVEFFIAFEDDEAYYNLEFNVIGTCKLNFGINRHDRKIISEKLISTIKYLATIQNKPGADTQHGVQWELTLMIPVEVFSEHNLTSLSGKYCSVNFYKCGDDLPVPHFLCWNNIKSLIPDFHVPEYFGKMLFL